VQHIEVWALTPPTVSIQDRNSVALGEKYPGGKMLIPTTDICKQWQDKHLASVSRSKVIANALQLA